MLSLLCLKIMFKTLQFSNNSTFNNHSSSLLPFFPFILFLHGRVNGNEFIQVRSVSMLYNCKAVLMSERSWIALNWKKLAQNIYNSYIIHRFESLKYMKTLSSLSTIKHLW